MRKTEKLGIVLWCMAAVGIIILGIICAVKYFSGAEVADFVKPWPTYLFLGCGMFIPVLVPYFNN